MTHTGWSHIKWSSLRGSHRGTLCGSAEDFEAVHLTSLRTLESWLSQYKSQSSSKPDGPSQIQTHEDLQEDMRDTYDSDNSHQFQTCVDLVRGCKAFCHKLELDNRERRLPRWRLRLYIGVIILLEFLFVIISVLLAPQIICGAIQETQSTCRQSVKGAQTLLGVYSTLFFVWGIVVAMLVYSLCRRRRQDVNKDGRRKTKEMTNGVAKSPEQSQGHLDQVLPPNFSTIRDSPQASISSDAEQRQRRQDDAREASAPTRALETGVVVQPNATYEHERQHSGDLGTRPLIGDGPTSTSSHLPPPPYSVLNSRVSEANLSVAAIQSATSSERPQLDDHEIQRMFHARMYPSRQRENQRRTANT